MTLARLTVDVVNAKTSKAKLLEGETVKATKELIGKTIYADTVKTGNLFMDSFAANDMTVAKDLIAKNLILNGFAKIATDLTISGTGVNGAALTVNGGEIVANKGIVSNTRNNRFQTMEITGSGRQ